MRRSVLVLGGSGGVGQEVVKALASDYHLYAVYHQNQELAKKLKNLAAWIPCDISDASQVDSAFGQLRDVSVVINAVSPRLILKKFEDTSVEEFDRPMNVLVKGSANVYRKMLPQLKNQKSVVIHLSSISVMEKPVERMCAYAVAKTAQQKMHDYLSVELKKSSVRVITLTPSFIETAALSVFPSKLLEMQKMQLPDQEFVQPRDLAQLIKRIIEAEGKFPHAVNLVLRSNQDVKVNLK